MMKVTVTKYLNVRVGSASVNAPCYQYLAPGSIIEVDDQVYKGDSYDGIDTWYRDKANNYYWTGGAEEVVIPTAASTPLLAATPSQLDWYHKEFQVTDIWEKFQTQGEGVRVAVIDSGIKADHPCFANADITGFNYANSNADIRDNHGHGSAVAGMISACGPGLIGVAPKAGLYIAKVYDREGPTPGDIADALLKLPSDIRIVVISQSFLKNEFLRQGMSQDSLIDIFAKSNKIICCAAGNNSNHEPGFPALDKMPASIKSPTMMSIGAVMRGGGIWESSCKSNFISLVAPGDNVKVVGINSSRPVYATSGTSFATPFAAAVLALIFSQSAKLGKPITNVQAVQQLLSNVRPGGNQKLFGNGIIDPLKTISKL